MKKKFLPFILVVLILFNVVTITYASNDNIVENRFINEDTYNSNELYFKLIDLGFSDKEIIDLYQREADAFGINFRLPEMLRNKTNLEKVESKSTNIKTIMLRTRNGEERKREISVNFDKVAKYFG